MKLEQFEEMINNILMAIGAFFLSIVHKIIPQKFFDKKNEFKVSFRKWKQKSKQRFTTFLIKIKGFIINFKNLLMGKIGYIQSLPIKEKTLARTSVIKKYLLTTPLKNHVLWISEKINHFLNKIRNMVNFIGKRQLMITFLVLGTMSVGLFTVYESSKQIYQQEFNSRTPASVQEYDEKPDYTLFKRKTAVIFKIQIPIFKKDTKSIRNITIDFTVRTSTRFAKQYLEFHQYKLKDYFFTNVEPFISSFPLEDEGKDVLKDKITYELNNFLAKAKVEGIVQEVNIVYMVGY